MTRTVLVTGASRGIGYATAERFAKHGDRICILGRNEKTIQDAGKRLGVLAIAADVSNPNDVTRAFKLCAEKLGPVDVLVNNAGILHMASFEETTPAQLQETLAVNVAGTMLCGQAAFAQMKSRGGVIVNVGSVAGLQYIDKFPGMSAYVASKFAVTGLTESMALEGKPHGIRVIAVAPAATDTEMLHKAAPDLKAEATPADVAEVIFALAGNTLPGVASGATFPLYSYA